MKKRFSLVLAVLLVVSMVGGSALAAGDPIRFAFSGPMTGDYAEYGQNFYAACEIAMEDINANGGLLDGRLVEFAQFDDKNSQEEVGAIAEMISADDSLTAVFGHFSSGVAMTAASTYMDTGIVLLSASSSHKDYSGIGEYIFRNNVLISQEVENVLQICEMDGAKRVGVIVLKNDWGLGALEALEKAYAEIEGKVGYEIVMTEEVMDGAEDFSANITKFINAECDTIFVLMMYATFAPFANQYRAMNPDIRMASVGSAYSTELINLGGSAVEGVKLVAGFNPESDNERAKEFVAKFNEKTGHDPDNMAVQTYENVMMVAAAIEHAGSTDRAAIKDALYEISYEGVSSGTLAFNEGGDVLKSQLVFEIQGDKFVERTDMPLKMWDEFVTGL